MSYYIFFKAFFMENITVTIKSKKNDFRKSKSVLMEYYVWNQP